MSIDFEPKDLYDLINNTSRVTHGTSSNWWDELKRIAHELYNMPTKNNIEDILIGGWHLDEEYRGGGENESGNREILGRDILLYRDTFIESEKEEPNWKKTSSIIVEAWKQNKKIIFLALQTVVEDGYVGIDNHHGIDTTWKIIGLRAVDYN